MLVYIPFSSSPYLTNRFPPRSLTFGDTTGRQRLSVIHVVLGTVNWKVEVRTSARAVSVAQTQPEVSPGGHRPKHPAACATHRVSQGLTYMMRSPVSLTRDSRVCLREAARGRLWLQRVPRWAACTALM